MVLIHKTYDGNHIILYKEKTYELTINGTLIFFNIYNSLSKNNEWNIKTYDGYHIILYKERLMNETYMENQSSSSLWMLHTLFFPPIS